MPSAAAVMPNSTPVTVDDSFTYHRPGSTCVTWKTRTAQITLAQGIVWCRPCACWTKAGAR